jgi:hypothetical protein
MRWVYFTIFTFVFVLLTFHVDGDVTGRRLRHVVVVGETPAAAGDVKLFFGVA